ncbi:unnamed protein product [Leptidea sinapis]|uniref:Uncharacterized protein n=1 Tax=Leptidea sinapis TaxID=189913 RepID=A0A5E4Q928_9NEOP|nr:unnamed protein product [Leptidea sinapis]
MPVASWNEGSMTGRSSELSEGYTSKTHQHLLQAGDGVKKGTEWGWDCSRSKHFQERVVEINRVSVKLINVNQDCPGQPTKHERHKCIRPPIQNPKFGKEIFLSLL